ncbi:MAG: helix-turn-helix domain-containing protein [Eubacteriales bacterium]
MGELNPFSVKFGENLAMLRKKKGLTKAGLGKLLDVSATSIGYWEKGKTKPKLDMMNKLADILEVPVSSLMNWDEEFNPDGKLAEEVKTLDDVSSQYGKEAVQMLELFSQLNAVGMVKALEYASDLAEQEKYKK